jgi:perosamine synthetase
MNSFFDKKSSFGDHTLYTYNTDKYDFRGFLQSIFSTDDLSQLHLQCKEYQDFQNGILPDLQDIETDIHKKFYKAIKSSDEYKQKYCALVKDIYTNFFPNEKVLIYQSFPSIRFQFIGNKAVPPHSDSDSLGCHPLGEKNFLVPITKMSGTTRLFIESTSGAGDFKGIDMEYGDLFYFNGNTCIHYNQKNEESYLRISFDFRVLTLQDYLKYVSGKSITTTNPRDPEKARKPVKMVVGGYYQCMFQNDSIEDILNWYSVPSKIIQTRPCFGNEEADAVSNYMRNGDPFYTEFQKTTELEKMICETLNVKHCLMTTSGTSALLLAYLGFDIGPGDEVIVPSYTMVATANAVKALGATPVFADVDPYLLTLTQECIKDLITPKTKAIVHVSLNNRQKKLQELVDFCKEKQIALIEDAAQSLGSSVNGKALGTFGDVGCFSLSTPKIISTGQGGFVVTNNDELAKKLFKIKNFGRRAGGLEEYDMFGLNLKFTDIQAVIGIEQMKKLPERILKMKEIWDSYTEGMKQVSWFHLVPPPEQSGWIPWFVDLYCEKGGRDEVADFLNKHNIQTRVTYPSVHSLPMYASGVKCPNTDLISKNGLFLPTHMLLTQKDIQFITRILRLYSLNE